MKRALKSLAALLIALSIMLIVRAFAFTIYSVPADIDANLRQGDRILVNRLWHANFHKGDLVVVDDSLPWAARILAVPGDTIIVRKQAYKLPIACCKNCDNPQCQTYVVTANGKRTLVQHYQISGKASRLYHLPW